jgi:hypothetical protein
MKQRWKGVPIVLLSGMLEPPESANSVDAFMSKADGREALVATIRRLLDTKN